MFCVKCGGQITDGGKFCPECGEAVAVKTNEAVKPEGTNTEAPAQNVQPQQPVQGGNPAYPVNPQYNNPPSYGQNPEGVLQRFEHSAKAVAKCVSTIVLSIIVGVRVSVLCIQKMNEEGPPEKYHFAADMKDDNDDYETAKYLLIIMIVVCAVSIGQSMSRSTQIKKNYLCICRDGVFGEGCASFGSGTKSFKVAYEDIKSVKVKSNDKLIIRGKRSYVCYVSNSKEAKKVIRHALDGHTPTAQSQF